MEWNEFCEKVSKMLGNWKIDCNLIMMIIRFRTLLRHKSIYIR